jgi:hypothetical protein
MTTRSIELLKTAADALLDGRDPFCDSWLSDNDVTLDECMTLAEQLAAGATILAWAMEHPKQALGAVNGAHMAAAYEALNAALAKWNPGGPDAPPQPR